MSYTRLKQLSALISSTAPMDLRLHGENTCQYSTSFSALTTQDLTHGPHTDPHLLTDKWYVFSSESIHL